MDALFGGSFDPVHIGHLVVAEAAADALGARIRFLPAREQPFKRAGHVATATERLEMLELAIRGNSRFSVDASELELPAPSYTVETLRTLSQREPGNRFALLLGADAARDLPGWHESEALPELAEIVAFARPGAPAPRHPLIQRVIDVPAIELSATDVRDRVARGLSIRYLVPDGVRDYIAARGLYR